MECDKKQRTRLKHTGSAAHTKRRLDYDKSGTEEDMASSKPRLEVQFSEKMPAYRSGRELAGAVTVDCHGGGLQHVTRFFVECLGYSEVQESGQKRLRRDHLSLKQNLLPGPNQVLESRRFEFRFRLPAGLPHSVECEDVGFVRYCCRAVVYLDASDPVETVGYFSLIEEVDLNSQSVQQSCRPGEQASASTVDRVGGRSGKDEVKAALVLTKGAYVPGENVECTLSVHSAACAVPAEQASSIRLVQTVTVVAENGRPASAGRSQTIAQVPVQADEQYSEHYWSARCQLHIPGAVASTLPSQRCQHPLIVTYAVEMSISLAFASSPVKQVTVSCPVIVGTVPLQEASNKPHPATMEPSFVDVCRCVISETEHGAVKEKHPRSSSLIGQLIPIGNRRKSSYRMAPPIQYTLYCIYYPTISLIRKQKGLKSILKRHSVDNSLDTVGVQTPSGSDHEQLQVTHRTASISWYETPL